MRWREGKDEMPQKAFPSGLPSLLGRAPGGEPWSWRSRATRLFVVDAALVIAALIITVTLTRGLWLPASNDPKLYSYYAYLFWSSPHALHAFPKEYPPLSVFLFSFTQFPGPDPVFAWEDWMAVIFLVGWYLFYRFNGRAAAWRYAVLVLVLQNLFLTRYDLVPGLICVGALWAAQRRAWRWAYALLALGTLLKLFPLFLVPIVMIEQWRANGGSTALRWADLAPERLRLVPWPAVWVKLRPVVVGLGVWVGIVALGMVIPFLLEPASLNSIVGYQSGRPIQVESTAATIVWLGTLVGIPAHIAFAFGSWDFQGPLVTALGPFATALLAVGVLVVYWLVWRRHLPLAQAFLFCLGMILLTNKVFSAQYMLWIVPVAAAAGTDFVVWLLAAVLTLVNYPILSAVNNTLFVDSTRWIVMLVLAARNILVAIGTVRALRLPAALRQSDAAVRAPEDLSPGASPDLDVSGTFAG